MEFSVWLTYLLAAIVLSVTPGPGVFSSIRSGLHHGVKRGVWNAVGMQVANLIHVIVVAIGLGAVLLASESLFTAIKWLGVAYLIYLGISTWRAPVHGFVDEADHDTTIGDIFLHGFLVNLTNPKAIVFIVAVLPQFIDVARPQALQYVIIGATTFAVDLVIMTGYMALAARVLRVMKDESRLRWINRGLGGLFVATGVALATFRRTAIAAG